jgi:glycosyltransferase involved in cell wall biosynthesis
VSIGNLAKQTTIGLWPNSGGAFGWVASTHLFLGLMTALKSLPGERPRLTLHMASGQTDLDERLVALADQVLPEPVPSPPLHELWKRRLLFKGKSVSLESQLGRFLRANGVDVLFFDYSVYSVDGPRLGIPVISWIHDFQHVHMPEMFSPEEIRLRDSSIRRTINDSDAIILTNTQCLEDLRRFSPDNHYKGRLLPIIVPIPDDVFSEDPDAVRRRYHLPEKFFYLPNHFWKHKNHSVVITAIASLRKKHPDAVVVCSGHTADYRHHKHFPDLLREIAMNGLHDNILIIGSVPYADVLQLMRQSLAVIQPSLYEGFGMTVAEADAIGKRLIVSDIPPHREQHPLAADFFDPHDPGMLAQCLEKVLLTTSSGPDYELERQAPCRIGARTMNLAQQFMQIVQEVTSKPH